MNSRIPEWVKPGIWGAVFGAAAIAIVGFSAGWVVSSGSAQEMAEAQAEKAVVAALTPVCVAQFRTAEQSRIHIAALEAEDSWKRSDYVVEHGWATMPGSTKANDEVAEACADRLLEASQT